MSLNDWARNGWLKSHKTSAQEVKQLLAMVDRDMDDAIYLDVCRTKRNIVEYEHISGVSVGDAEELIGFNLVLKEDVLEYLKTHHPELVENFPTP